MVRDSYLNLNGPWQYAVTTTVQRPAQWAGDIIVPYAPPSRLSGCSHILQPGETLWYRRFFLLPLGFLKERLLLHFGGVDQDCTVYINGKEAGRHRGGFLPFSMDITSYLTESAGPQEILLASNDPTDTAPHARGRQKLEGRGRRHIPFSGIWQTVWLESVPETYIQSLRITPLYDDSAVEVTVYASAPAQSGEAQVFARSTLVTGGAFRQGEALRLPLSGAISWSPKNPFLYKLTVILGDDVVESYFGMRKIHVQPGAPPCLMLNNKPFACLGVTSQGLYSDGYYTPAAEKTMEDDILLARECGFNTIHLHGKVAPLRWYHLCDKLGMLVWQELPAGGSEWRPTLKETLSGGTPGTQTDDAYKRFGRESEEGRNLFVSQMEALESLLHNSPGLIGWSLFGSAHGQFNAAKAAETMRKADTTRLWDHALGWYDQGVGDVFSTPLPLYNPKKPLPAPAPGEARAFFIAEAGSFCLLGTEQRREKHLAGKHAFYDETAFADAYFSLFEKQLVPLAQKGLCGYFYYQLSDALDERDGIISFDRRIQKMRPATLAAANKTLEGAILAAGQPP